MLQLMIGLFALACLLDSVPLGILMLLGLRRRRRLQAAREASSLRRK